MLFLREVQFENALVARVARVYSPEQLNELAREHGFIQRSGGKLTAPDFVALLTLELLDDGAISLAGRCDLLHERKPEGDLSPQALSERINSEGARCFLQGVLQGALRENLKPALSVLDPEVLQSFPRVFLQDSTQGSLHEHLSEAFKGSGGAASISSLKIDLLFEVKHQGIHTRTLPDGQTPDQALAQHSLSDLQAHDVVIRDLGYFVLDALGQITEKDAGDLSRLDPKVTV